MTFLVYYLLIKPLSLLPLRVLYIFSDGFFGLSYLGLGYRKSVVRNNLAIAFPDKSLTERKQIEKKFYRHFYDLVAEGIRLFSMPEKEALARFKVVSPAVYEQLAQEEKSAILVGGHYQNWELFAVATNPQIPHTILGVYTPLSNHFFEHKFSNSRTRLGMVLIPKKHVRKYLKEYKNELVTPVFAIDQSPRAHQKVFWTKFLGVDTAVHFGAEKYAKEFDLPVVYGRARKPKRGHYELEFILMERNPRDTSEGEITRKHTQLLEQQILEAPQYWLWTHKRWKLKRLSGQNE